MVEGEYTGEIKGGKGLVSKVCYVNFPGAVSGLIRFYLGSRLVIQNLPALTEGEGQQVLLMFTSFLIVFSSK